MEQQKIWLRFSLRIVFFCGGMALVYYVLPWIFSLFTPFLLAIWVASLLNPLVTLLEGAMGWKRRWIVLWLLFFVALILLSTLWLVIPALVSQLWALGENWEGMIEAFVGVMREVEEKIRGWNDPTSLFSDSIQEGMEELKDWVGAMLGQFFRTLGDYFLNLPAYTVGFLVFLMACFFMTTDYPFYMEKLRLHSSKEWRWWAGELKESAVEAFGGYLRAQLMLSTGVCVIMLGGFLALGLRFAFVLAVVIALLDFIPMIGSGMVLIPWAGVRFLTGETGEAWTLFGIWLLTALFRYVLEPKILGQQTGLSPLLSLIGIYTGLQIGGILGMILAPVVLLMLLHFLGMGIFAGTISDLKLCLLDLRRLFEENKK